MSAAVAVGDLDLDGEPTNLNTRCFALPAAALTIDWLLDARLLAQKFARLPPTTASGDLDVFVTKSTSGSAAANELLMFTHCGQTGARLHGTSGCFECPDYMARRTDNDICEECLPDTLSGGANLKKGEICPVQCPLQERPLGATECTATDLEPMSRLLARRLPACFAIYTTVAGTSCAAGTSFNNVLVRSETDWPAGSFPPRCQDCVAGSYSDGITPAVNDCYPCIPGQQAPNNGSSSCTACPSGSFSTRFNAVECDPCPIGGASSEIR